MDVVLVLILFIITLVVFVDVVLLLKLLGLLLVRFGINVVVDAGPLACVFVAV
jgi:hypothetical protein